mmetsp:Transcript_48615/g.126125  ORF Transcript_48615/g.126125 Transcript_48615/m.126125 type:complete len:225 (-) Transcript_48615:41-715(-)
MNSATSCLHFSCVASSLIHSGPHPDGSDGTVVTSSTCSSTTPPLDFTRIVSSIFKPSNVTSAASTPTSFESPTLFLPFNCTSPPLAPLLPSSCLLLLCLFILSFLFSVCSSSDIDVAAVRKPDLLDSNSDLAVIAEAPCEEEEEAEEEEDEEKAVEYALAAIDSATLIFSFPLAYASSMSSSSSSSSSPSPPPPLLTSSCPSLSSSPSKRSEEFAVKSPDEPEV